MNLELLELKEEAGNTCHPHRISMICVHESKRSNTEGEGILTVTG